MTSVKGIAEAIGGALVLIWAIYTELRLRQAQSKNTQLKRSYNDKVIEDSVHAESDSDLASELSKDTKS